jgi:bifunctional non-homologous end joining protein LigD
VDGVLKSWAIPKRPTLDPTVKRLAVHVEDHPLEYSDFEGEIPEGEYGAGKVEIWDRGFYEDLHSTQKHGETISRSIRQGRLELFLHGHRLKGRFALIRMKNSDQTGDKKKDNWLLIKLRDGGREDLNAIGRDQAEGDAGRDQPGSPILDRHRETRRRKRKGL